MTDRTDEGMPTALTVPDEQDKLIETLFGTPAAEATEAEVVAYVDALLGALGELEQELSSLSAATRHAVKRVTDRYAEVAHPLHERAQRLNAEIQRAAMMLGRSEKKKSRTLPSGTVGWRLHPDTLSIDDPEKCLHWIRDKGLAGEVLEVRTTEHLKANAIKAHIKATGEVPDGCTFTAGEDEFYAKPRAVEMPRLGSARTQELAP
jgi:phage host-nuclease inhibitor protein Gam